MEIQATIIRMLNNKKQNQIILNGIYMTTHVYQEFKNTNLFKNAMGM